MRVVIINRSDLTGGAAVVSFRLMEALRNAGVDARMLVAEKLSDSPFVIKAAPEWKIKEKFIAERLDIFFENGFDRSTLFKIDNGSSGLPLWKHPLVKEADAVLLNWINQGMLSLSGVEKILRLGKPVIWTMHDLWCFTGICHHPYDCTHYQRHCGNCPLLGNRKKTDDLSYKTWKIKKKIYDAYGGKNLRFVAVSRWLAGKASQSSLLSGNKPEVIHNALPFESCDRSLTPVRKKDGRKTRILFGAARIDDPVKGFDIFTESLNILKQKYPQIASDIEVVTFGRFKDPAKAENLSVPAIHLGLLSDQEKVKETYEDGDILVSASVYETLPTTLVEAQLYGCIPVSFDRGGQSDIVEHQSSGFLARLTDNIAESAANLADEIAGAYTLRHSSEFSMMQKNMLESVISKFSPDAIARKYINLISEISSQQKS